MLSLEQVHAGYGEVEVLHGVSLAVQEGEIVAIIGANGAGKSTLLKAISSLVPCDGGKVEFEERDITNLATEDVTDLGIVQVPEGRQLFGALSVEENLMIGTYSSRKRCTDKELSALWELAFDLFPILHERKNQRAGTLSGGEQQMLAIARALMADPKLLLLDEPSLGLAPLVVETIFSALKTLNEKRITMMLVEQNALLALNLAQRGYLMDLGRIALEAPAEALLRDPKVKETYLGELAATELDEISDN